MPGYRPFAGLLLMLLSGWGCASSIQTDLWSLYREAARQDPRLQHATALQEASTHRKREARGHLLPQLALNGAYNRSRHAYDSGTVHYDGRSQGLSLHQPLYDPAAWWAYRKFREQSLQQHQVTEDVRSRVGFEIAELYFAILAAEDERRLIEAELQATQRNQKRIQALYRRQMAMLTDVLEADARVTALQANLLDAETTEQNSREAMAERIGRPLHEPLKRLGLQPDYSQLRRHSPDWVATALKRNPALLSQEHAVAVAEHAVQEAKAGHLPQLSLNLSAQRSDIGYEGNATPQSTSLVAALGIQIPIYNGGSTSARTAALSSEMDASTHEQERLRREVARQTRAALLKVEAAPTRIRAAEQAQAAAIKSRQAAERAFELGVFNAVDVLERVRDEFRARRDLLRSQYSYITQLLLLYRWSGTLDEEDVRHCNELLTQQAANEPALTYETP